MEEPKPGIYPSADPCIPTPAHAPGGPKPPLPDPDAGRVALRARTAAILEDPDFLPTVCAHVANGGSLIGLAETMQARYSDLIAWVQADDARLNPYLAAMDARDAWEKEALLADLRGRMTLDIRQIYDDDGALKPASQWPKEAARYVEELTSEDVRDSDGEKIGETRKVKLMSRLKSMELAMKAKAMLVERKEVVLGLRLEDILAASIDADPPPPIDAEVVRPAPQAGDLSQDTTTTNPPPEIPTSQTGV